MIRSSVEYRYVLITKNVFVMKQWLIHVIKYDFAKKFHTDKLSVFNRLNG